MAATTHFPNGLDVDIYSIGGVVSAHIGGKHGVAAATHFPNDIVTPVLSVGGSVVAGSGTPTTHFPSGIDVTTAVTIG